MPWLSLLLCGYRAAKTFLRFLLQRKTVSKQCVRRSSSTWARSHALQAHALQAPPPKREKQCESTNLVRTEGELVENRASGMRCYPRGLPARDNGRKRHEEKTFYDIVRHLATCYFVPKSSLSGCLLHRKKNVLPRLHPPSGAIQPTA